MVAMQKAVLVREIGTSVQLGTREIPSPGKGQVLVRVTATMILPHDTYGRDWGLLLDQRLPAVLGNNVAGVVEKASAGVAFKVGERVFGISSYVAVSSDQAGLQEYAVLNANAIGKIPEGFSDEQVVSLPINLVTSAAVLFTRTGFDMPAPFVAQKSSDDAANSVVIIGGGTNVGKFAVQLARIAGVGKIIVIAGAANNDQLKSMGATHVIDRHGSATDIAHQIQRITDSDGATQVYNCAQLHVDLAVGAISASKPSRLRLLLPLEGEQADQLRSQRPLCDASFVDDLTNESLAPNASLFWEKVPQWLTDGNILPTEYRLIHGLDKVTEINEALDAYREFTRVGAQAVVKIQD